MGTAHPVFFLPEMALAAHLVTVIHIYFRSGFGHQKITLLLVMTRIAGQRFIRTAMIQSDITMGYFGSIGDTDRCVVVALTAFKAFHLFLAGFRPETPLLIGSPRQNRIFRQSDDR